MTDPPPPSESAPPEPALAWVQPRLIAAAVLLLIAGGVWLAPRLRQAPTEPTQSLAVLPFQHSTADTGAGALIPGIHAELVAGLAKTAGLRVVSRTSALEYPGSGGGEQVIARELDVATLLTGSVRRSGDRVRITAALQDAGRAKELWSETYERRLSPENLFDIQADVVRRVASALDLPLSSRLSRALSRPPTGDLEALDLYYRGLRMWDTRGPGSSRDSARTLLIRQAVTRDSNFVAAWSLLARSGSWDLRTGSAGDTLTAWRAVERTIALAPGSLEAHLASGYYRFYAQGDYAAALAQFDAADRLLPNDSELWHQRGLLLRRLGRWQEAMAMLRRARAADPRNVRVLHDLGESYAMLRRWDGAETELRRALTLSPASDHTLLTLIEVRLNGRGDTLGARALLEASRPLLTPASLGRLNTRLALLASRDLRSARKSAERWPTGDYTPTYGTRLLTLALIARAAGDWRLERRYTDSLLREADTEIRLRQGGGRADPFGDRALVELCAATGYALRGDSTRALALLRPAAERFTPERDAVNGPEHLRWVAATYMLVGRTAEAIETLRRAVTLPSLVNLEELRRDPLWEPLRKLPEFQRLVARR